MQLSNKIKNKRQASRISSDLFKNEEGAIDLSSIMVGIIVIGLIGGVIAATVFAVIPWSQDNAAKQQLDSVVSAESAYFGLSADNPPALPAGSKPNSFGKSAELATANLLQAGPRYCVTTPADSKSYDAYSQSSSGKIFTVTDKNSKPVIFTGTLPTDCQFIADGVVSATPAPPAPYVDPTPTLTVLTYKCDTALAAGAIPMYHTLRGTETWNDGINTNTYNGTSGARPRSFAAGVTYTVTFDGTYTDIMNNGSNESIALTKCLRSVDHWGMNTGVTDASRAFSQASKLTSVPDHIPATITNVSDMFNAANSFNDPSISKWDVSNITIMNSMFYGTTIFNQPLNNWNVSNVTSMQYMFKSTRDFSQPLNKWNTSKVVSLMGMFESAQAFNQPIDAWNVSSVTDMSYMFRSNTIFVQDLHTWNTVKVTQGSFFAPTTFPIGYLPPKTTRG